MSSPRVYIIILNWNGWKDTIECLESVFRIGYPDYRVIVCDNGSEDGSLEHIKAWAEGRLQIEIPENNPLRSLSFPPVLKPIPYVEYDRNEAEKGGNSADCQAPMVIIRTGSNLGFAGGCNVGLRYALARDDFAYVWLLNNDTVVKPDALCKLVQRMAEKPEAGMCGGTLAYYHQHDKVQTLGGATYNKWFATTKHIGLFQSSQQPVNIPDIERQMSYIRGACLLVTKPFLRDVGLMCEDYFLFFEELDWALRARGRYSLAYASESIVYHKEGKATGGNNCGLNEKSETSDYFFIKNRLIVTRRYFPLATPTVYLGLLITIINRIRRRRWDRIGMILKLALTCGRTDSKESAE